MGVASADVSPEVLRRLIHASIHPVVLLRADLRVVEVNAAYLQIVGLESGQVLDRDLFEIGQMRRHREVNLVSYRLLNEALAEVMATGRAVTLPLFASRMPFEAADHAGNRERWWSMTVTPLLDAAQRVEYVLVEADDKTDLQHFRRQLAADVGRAERDADAPPAAEASAPTVADADREFLLQLFHQAPGFIGVLRGPEHTIVTANMGFKQLLAGANIVGKPLPGVVPELVDPRFTELLDEVYQNGRVFLGRNIRTVYFKTPDNEGSPMYLDLLLQPLLDDRGQVNGIFIQGTDVTERKVAEDEYRRANELLEERVRERTAQLLASQDQLRVFFHHSAEYYAVVRALDSNTFVYEELNPAAIRMLGRPREELIGRTTREVLGPQAAEEFLDSHLRECIRLGKQVRYEARQGRQVIDVLAVPVSDAFESSTRIIMSARDVTESHALEEQLRQAQKMEAVGQLTGGIAHDFNNLLTVIIGNLDRLQRRVSDDELKAATSQALESARNAANLTHRLLAFSRKQQLEPRPVEVNALIAALSDLLKRSLGERIVVETSFEPKVWTTSVDPHQVENALLNLALNARDAMPNGGTLFVGTSNVWLEALIDSHGRPVAPGEYVRIFVRDTGAGMPPDVLARAFEPFFTTKDVGQGSGLGLAMIYGFVKQSGGHIRIESRVGGGTLVEIYLPRYYGEEAQPVVAEAPVSSGPVPRKRILVVEDHDAVRQYTVDALREEGHEVIAAGDAPRALELLNEVPIDLMFTDLVLPGTMSGHELARLARQQQPSIKVLYTTGYDRNVLGSLENNHILLAKPFTLAQLCARIKSLFEES